MTPSEPKPATWILDDERWSQTENGTFDLTDFRGLGAPAPAYQPEDVARLTGAHTSHDAADRGNRTVALYPGPFGFSPVTGRPLADPLAPPANVWLPPFGLDGVTASSPVYGFRLTPVALSLPESLRPEFRPEFALATPPAGNYQFIVGMFLAKSPSLVAIEPSRGLLYAWLPTSNEWREIAVPESSEEGDAVGESALPEHAWSMAADLWGTRELFLPTERGLAAVRVNILALSHQATVAGSRCVGAPVLFQGQIYVPMQDTDGHAYIYACRPAAVRTGRSLPVRDAKEAFLGWTPPIVRARDIVWMSPRGQLWLKQAGTGGAQVSFIPWPPGITPRFDLGSPYLSHDGKVWQQCFEGDGTTGHFVFVQLMERNQPERRSINSPALSTGSTSFRLEVSLPDNPWEEPRHEPEAPADEIVIPLLESKTRSTILCVRVPSTGSVASLFDSLDKHTVTFELRGERRVLFWTTELARPWATRPFVFDGSLYLYHPDFEHIYGWRMS